MLSVNVVSQVRTFTTTTGRTVYVLDGESGFDLDALVAACTSKACAPPPTGTGGSLPTHLSRGVRVEVSLPDLLKAYGDRSALADLFSDHVMEGRIDRRRRTGEAGRSWSTSEKTAKAFAWETQQDDSMTSSDRGRHTARRVGDSWIVRIPVVMHGRPEIGKSDDWTGANSRDLNWWAEQEGEVRVSKGAKIKLDSVSVALPPRKELERILADTNPRNTFNIFGDPESSEWVNLTMPLVLTASVCVEHGEFVCTSKACAPPPVGTGGSLPTAVQHVTSREAAESIKKGGFVVGYGGMHGSQFGYGVYMSRAGDRMSKFYRKATQKEGHEAALVQGTVHLKNAVKVTGNTKDELFREIVKKLGGADGVERVAQSSYERLRDGAKSALRKVLGEDAVGRVDWDGEFETDPVFNDMTREQYGKFNTALSEFLPHGVESFGDLSGIGALRKMSSGAATKSSWLKSVSNLLADLGHDGIEVTNPSETEDVGGSQIVVFDPKTITVNSVEDFGALISEFGIEVTLDYEPVVFACEEHGEFACNSKSCAPPPVGTGGSLSTGSAARAALGGRTASEMVARMYEARGFNAKPQVVSDAQFTHLIRQGKVREAWRGVSLVSGEKAVPESVVRGYERDATHPVVEGSFGSGTYVAVGRHGEREARQYAGKGGSVLRIGIPPQMGSEPDLREITEVLDRMTRGGAGVKNFQPRNVARGAALYKTLRDARVSDDEVRRLTSDQSLVGMLMGWDGVYVSNEFDKAPGYAVVWNRGATVVSPDVITAAITIGFMDGVLVAACDLHGEFACNSKACAPPPVGMGGSLPSGSSVRGTSPLPAGASAEQFKEFRESYDSPLWQGVSKRLVGADGILNPFEYDRKVEAKVQVNNQIIGRASKNPQFQRGLKQVLDQEIDLDRLRDVFQGILHGDAVSDMVMEASRQGTGNSQGTPAWYTAESGTTVRQLLERLASDELYEGMRTNPLSGLTPEEIATRILTRDFVSGWAASSNDSDPRSISKQMAAAEMHGIDYEKFYREYRHKGIAVDKLILDDARRQLTEHRDILQGLTQSEYDATQDFFREQGITSVTLYRGVRFPSGGNLPSNGDVVESASNPLSSWTVNYRTAYSGFGLSVGETEGRTFAMEVPVEMIQATPVTGRGCLDEYEVVVIGYPSEMLTVSGGDKWVA